MWCCASYRGSILHELRDKSMKRSVTLRTVLLLLGIYVPLVVLSTLAVHARAGGGDAFGGGSFGGGSLGGGGGGFSSGFFFLPLIFGGGSGSGISIVIFLIIFFVVVPYFMRRFGPPGNPTGNGYRGYGMGRRMGFMNGFNQYPPADLSIISNDDPDFSKERFLDKVQTYFFAIQKAWSNNDLGPVRGYMTDAMYQRLNTQISDMKARNIINKLDQVAVGSISIVSATKDEKYETLVCRIWASMIDYKVQATDGKVISGDSHSANKFVEFWSFIRSNSAKTKEVDTIATKTCPNCGAPLDINEFGQCQYCKAYVISGDFDWVLTDISETFNQ
jgi:hypothetical protein